MIILIGGSSHVGKTFLAQKIMEKTQYPYVSLDHLKMGLIRTGMTSLTPEDDYEMRYFLWPFAAEIIKTAIENDQNMIMEGCYIPGEWRDSFTPEYLEKIRCVFITMTPEYIEKNFDGICSEANVIEHRINDDPDKDRLIRCSENFRDDCVKFDINRIEISEKFCIDRMIEAVTDICEKDYTESVVYIL